MKSLISIQMMAEVEDREYIESLVGYSTYDTWHQYDNELPLEDCCDKTEDDLCGIAPDGGFMLPSVKMFAKHSGSRYEIENHEDDFEDESK